MSEHKSESIAELAKALAAAQRDMNPASKNAKNPQLHNKYADLSSCIAAAREVLPQHGLSYTQILNTSEITKTLVPMGNGKVEEQEVIRVYVTTILMHESGQWIQSTCTLPSLANKGVNPAQAAGSAITYARRYGLSSIIGLATDDDDDGCASGPMGGYVQQRQQPRQERRPQPVQESRQEELVQGTPVDTVSPTMRKLFAVLAENGLKEKDAALAALSEFFGRQITSRADLTDNEALDYINALQQQPVPADCPY